MKNNLHTISAHEPFAQTLARWVLARWGAEPLALTRLLIFLPSRRAVLSLREAFLRASEGKALLLPRIEPLGDADEDLLLISPLASLLPLEMPAETFAFRRLFLLSRLVQRHREQLSGKHERADHAMKLAAPLADLLDELEREEAALDGVASIVPDAFAAHWQTTVEFLKILSLHWPAIVREEKLTSPGEYNARVLKSLAQHWQATPPSFSVIVAGTTGSNPATAALIAAIAGLKGGHVVLPGLDMQADDAYFGHLGESHPQWGMAQLLKKVGCARGDVQVIGGPAVEREKLMSEVMRPAEVSEAWRAVAMDVPQALQGLSCITCDHLQEEAMTVALLLREALEKPGFSAALVTQNRSLARRVAAIMRRFGVMIDDSAGIPFAQTPLVSFLRLILETALEDFAALPLLSLLKHPLTQAGMERIACLETARELEIQVLRGLCLNGGLEGMRQSLLGVRDASAEIYTLLDRMERAFLPLREVLLQQEVSLAALMDAHLACAQELGGEDLWSGPESDGLAKLLRDARGAAESCSVSIEGDSYLAVFEELLAGKVYRPAFGMHPRLKILSPIEARMQSFDRIILGGMNEKSWPQQPVGDPWFSRPMRVALGLPAPERALGLSAHDFFMLACGPEVILTRSAKEDGVPTTASRWLAKLGMLAGGLPKAADNWRGWALALDGVADVTPAGRPVPAPPLVARPREVSVTRVEMWMRDPYAFYASQILRLRPLEPLARVPDGSDFGNGVHAALEHFVKQHPATLPPDALTILLRLGREAFAELFAGSHLELLWWPRFARIAQWFIAREEERRPSLRQVESEVQSACRFGELLLKGRADRLEEGRDGSLNIIDYKTGGLPPAKDIESGLSSQLVLLALIAREGKADGSVIASPHGGRGDPNHSNKQDRIASSPAASRNDGQTIYLEYWRVQGREVAGVIEAINPAKIDGLIDSAKKGLERLIALYGDPSFPYRCLPIASRAGRYSDYDHLARVKEWE